MVSAFFPLEAERRLQASPRVIGIIFAAFPFAVMVSAPAWALLTPRFGRIPIYMAGTCVMAAGMFWVASLQIRSSASSLILLGLE
jgi:MFS family permease